MPVEVECFWVPRERSPGTVGPQVANPIRSTQKHGGNLGSTFWVPRARNLTSASTRFSEHEQLRD